MLAMMVVGRHVNVRCPGGRVNLAKGFVEAWVHGVGEMAKEGGVDRNRVKPICDVLSRCSTILCRITTNLHKVTAV